MFGGLGGLRSHEGFSHHLEQGQGKMNPQTPGQMIAVRLVKKGQVAKNCADSNLKDAIR